MTRRDLAGWLVVHGVPAIRMAGAMLAIATLVGALMVMAGGCSSGPQAAGTGAATSPSCAWTFTAGGETPSGAALQLCNDCTIERVEMSCLFDRTSSTPISTQRGVETGPVEVSPETEVSAIPGAP